MTKSLNIFYCYAFSFSVYSLKNAYFRYFQHLCTLYFVYNIQISAYFSPAKNAKKKRELSELRSRGLEAVNKIGNGENDFARFNGCGICCFLVNKKAGHKYTRLLK